MKLIFLGKIDKKALIILSIYTIILILYCIMEIIFNEFGIEKMNNLELLSIIYYSSYIFYGIPEYINRKKESNKKKSEKADTNNENENRIIYIFTFEHKTINIKSLILLLIGIFLYSLFDYGIKIYSIYRSETSKLPNQEISETVEILSVIFIYKFFDKIIFYKHQCLSLIIFISMELIIYFIKLFYLNNFKNISFEFPNDLYLLIPILIFDVFEAIYFSVIKLNMKKY